MATSPSLVTFPFEDYDGGRSSALIRTTDGYEGTRYALVYANDLGEALACPSLPTIGDPWSSLIPGAIVQRVGPAQYYGGKDADANNRWLVPIEYGPPQFGGAAATPRYRSPGDAITELVTGVEQQTAYLPVTQFGAFQREEVTVDGIPVVSTPPQSPIANGDGVSVEVGTLGANVSVWYEPNAAVNVARLTGLSRPSKLNLTALTLPPVEFSTARIPFSPRQVRYRGFAYGIEFSGRSGLDGSPTPLLRVVHNLVLAESHDVIWQATDAAGEPVAHYYKDRVYRDADMDGLWP